MPNVGKSSLINALRRTYLKKGIHGLYSKAMLAIIIMHVRAWCFHLSAGKGASIGSIPGITKTVSYKIMVNN